MSTIIGKLSLCENSELLNMQLSTEKIQTLIHIATMPFWVNPLKLNNNNNNNDNNNNNNKFHTDCS